MRISKRRLQNIFIFLIDLRVWCELCEAQIDERADDNEEVEAVPRIREIVLEAESSELEHELADKEEGEEQIDVIQKVCVPLGLIIHLQTKVGTRC